MFVPPLYICKTVLNYRLCVLGALPQTPRAFLEKAQEKHCRSYVIFALVFRRVVAIAQIIICAGAVGNDLCVVPCDCEKEAWAGAKPSRQTQAFVFPP